MASTASPLVILITGANRGIGLCIVERLLRAFPHNKYILASRDLSKGQSSLSALQAREPSFSACHIELLELDVSSTSSITNAIAEIRKTYGVLDVLINNAGVAHLQSNPNENNYDDLVDTWQDTFKVNVLAPHILYLASKDLLVKSKSPRVINVSSGRASMDRSDSGKLPPTAVVSYSISKIALNGVGLEMAKTLSVETSERSRVWIINPGHCKTAFNGYKGTRDPMDGAYVIELLLKHDVENDPIDSGFWEETEGQLHRVPW